MKFRLSWTDKRTFSPADGSGAPPAEAAAAPIDAQAPEAAAPAPAAPAAPDLSWLPEEYRGPTGLNAEAFRPHYQELLAEQARRADAPRAPEDGAYNFALPENLTFGDLPLPENFAVNVKPDDPEMQPLFGELADFLKANNLPQDAATGVMGMLAKYEAVQQSRQFAAAKAEAAKLGATPAAQQARLSTIKRSLESRLPPAGAGALMAAASTYEGVKALEALLAPRGGQPPVPRPASASLEGLTPYERLKQINRQQK